MARGLSPVFKSKGVTHTTDTDTDTQKHRHTTDKAYKLTNSQLGNTQSEKEGEATPWIC